jgi:hypothetical protein
MLAKDIAKAHTMIKRKPKGVLTKMRERDSAINRMREAEAKE